MLIFYYVTLVYAFLLEGQTAVMFLAFYPLLILGFDPSVPFFCFYSQHLWLLVVKMKYRVFFISLQCLCVWPQVPTLLSLEIINMLMSSSMVCFTGPFFLVCLTVFVQGNGPQAQECGWLCLVCCKVHHDTCSKWSLNLTD